MKLFKFLYKKVAPFKAYKYTGMVSDCSGRLYGTDFEDEAELLNGGYHTREDGIIVCITCGGNCGQCGGKYGRGVPANMQSLVDSLTGQLPVKYPRYKIIGQNK